MTSDDSGERSGRVAWRFAGAQPRPWIRTYDALVGAGLAGGYLATFAIPGRLDPWIAQQLTRLFTRLRRKNVAATEATLRRAMGPRADAVDMTAAVENYYASKFESAVGRVRGMHPGAWRPRITVEGREHVDAALAAGRGAILWRMDMGDTLHLQRGAWESGWPLVQLSSQGHGVTNSRFGFRFGAPMYARPENVYLTERVMIPPDWSFGYLPRLVRALEANQVVAILGEVFSRQAILVPVFQGQRAVATGAPGLAHRTGAALIPAATFREGRWNYRVRLGPPIEVDRSIPRRPAIEEPTRKFGRMLEDAVAEHPGDYNGWWLLRYRRDGVDGEASDG